MIKVVDLGGRSWPTSLKVIRGNDEKDCPSRTYLHKDSLEDSDDNAHKQSPSSDARL